VIYAVALTPAELALVVRAVRAHPTEQFRTKANVIHMLQHALDERDLAAFAMAAEEAAP
jgi:hypothetical protein